VAMGSLPGPWAMFTAAVAAHTMGRVAAVGMAGTMKLATHSGLGADYGRSTTRLRAIVSVICGTALTAVVVGWWELSLAVAALGAVVATGTLAKRKIGGISGDVLGATEQMAEILCLVVLTAQAAS